jgi:hypothetical protein
MENAAWMISEFVLAEHDETLWLDWYILGTLL